MNHSFQGTGISGEICMKCGRDKIDHTDRATCEVCGNSGEMEILEPNILACVDCQAREHAAEDIRAAEQNRRAKETQKRFIQVDSALAVQTDIFNAETVAIAELAKTMIDMELAVIVDKRFQTYLELIFKKRQEIQELESKVRATQTYFNGLSRKLREDERAKLKIKDSTYVIKSAPKKPVTGKNPVRKQSFNMTELRDAISAAGLPEAAQSAIQMIVLQRKVTAAQACEVFKKINAELDGV